MKKILLLTFFMAAGAVFGADFFINDVKISKNYAETESEWQYSRKINLPGEDFPEEFKIPPKYLILFRVYLHPSAIINAKIGRAILPIIRKSSMCGKNIIPT